MHHYYQQGLISKELWERELAGLGFGFTSEIGLRFLDIMEASDVKTPTWKLLKESAKTAKAFCESSENECLDRYTQPRN